MYRIRHFWLLPGQKPGDVVGATVVISPEGRMKVQEWVLTPDRMVLQRWLLPPGMIAE